MPARRPNSVRDQACTVWPDIRDCTNQRIEPFVFSQYRRLFEHRAASFVAGRQLKRIDKVGECGSQRSAGLNPVDGLGEPCMLHRIPSATGYENSAPSPRIIGMNVGKLVAMNAVSSTLTGLSDASPITSADIAMRWSMWVVTRPPPGT